MGDEAALTEKIINELSYSLNATIYDAKAVAGQILRIFRPFLAKDKPVQNEDNIGYLIVATIANNLEQHTWEDEWRKFYDPAKWLGSHRAAATFLTEKMRPTKPVVVDLDAPVRVLWNQQHADGKGLGDYDAFKANWNDIKKILEAAKSAEQPINDYAGESVIREDCLSGKPVSNEPKGRFWNQDTASDEARKAVQKTKNARMSALTEQVAINPKPAVYEQPDDCREAFNAKWPAAKGMDLSTPEDHPELHLIWIGFEAAWKDTREAVQPVDRSCVSDDIVEAIINEHDMNVPDELLASPGGYGAHRQAMKAALEKLIPLTMHIEAAYKKETKRESVCQSVTERNLLNDPASPKPMHNQIEGDKS